MVVVKRVHQQKRSIGALLGISTTFIGTVIGAGFASGQEIYQFFSIHGLFGWAGLILAVVLLGYMGEKVFRIGWVLKPKSYRDFLVYILGHRLALIADVLLFSFFMILIGVMLAGSGTVFESINLNYWVGVITTALLLIIVLFFDLPGLILVNLMVVPLMFAGSFGISIYSVLHRCTIITTGPFEIKWILAALQFSSYNLVLAIPVLLSLAKEFPSLNFLKWGGWMGSIGLGLMAGVIHWALLCHLSHLQQSALPMVDLAKQIGKYPSLGYALVLWGEMFTTLLANAYGVSQRLVSVLNWPHRRVVIVITIGGILIAQLGFVNLIAKFYPLFGYLCLIILVLLITKRQPYLRN